MRICLNLLFCTFFSLLWANSCDAQNIRPPTDWWASNKTEANIGPGPYGGTKESSGNCESCLRASGINYSPAWTGKMNQVGNINMGSVQGCEFYVYYSGGPIQESGCVVVHQYFCPPGYSQSDNYCIAAGPDPDKNKGCGGCEGGPPLAEGNPIHPGVGNKYQIERDYVGYGLFPLNFTRVYNSFGSEPGNVLKYAESLRYAASMWGSHFNSNGAELSPTYTPIVVGRTSHAKLDRGWRHNYDRTIQVTSSSVMTYAKVIREDSKVATFTLTSGEWTSDVSDRATKLVEKKSPGGSRSGWQYFNEHDETENYDAAGRLVSIVNRRGNAQILTYDVAGRLEKIEDPAKRTISITYDEYDRVAKVTDPAGREITYEFDSIGNLSKVVYPDSKLRRYLYGDTRFMYALTGIIDENGKRLISWEYDEWGRAITSSKAGDIAKVELSYEDGITRSKHANGMQRIFYLNTFNGIVRARHVSEVCGTGCDRGHAYTYDINGNVATSTDWNNVRTEYTSDPLRKLVTRRVDALGTAQMRVTTTEWHPTFRLPVKIAEGGRLTAYDYDTMGNLLSKTERATSDASGANGLAAPLVGSPRVWRYTYNTAGQVKTATGPRTDVVSVTQYEYDTLANLVLVTNGANQKTVLGNYDASGRAGQITDPNNLVTELSYSPRGWLTSSVVGGEVTSYEHDGLGQLKVLTLPDSTKIAYTYDDAHRLTGIADNLGNSITYRLDLAGNRKDEEVRDPSNNLARQTTRVFDLLNQLKQITGAQP